MTILNIYCLIVHRPAKHKNMEQEKRNIFKSWGGYAGLVTSFIIILQIRVFRVLITEGSIEENYACNLLPFFNCINILIAIIIIILLIGFIIGGIFQSREANNNA